MTIATPSPSPAGPASSAAPAHSHHPPANTSAAPSTSTRQPCAKCGLSMTGQFVRALGTVYHLDCFRCADCGKVVASKFFPVDDDSSNNQPQQYPLCETDYFRRLGLICAKCGGALRGSYITALDMKFHVEHFTCSVCPTVFGPQDSYYEHSGHVYCHYHYSTRFAVKCTGCQSAILKQFVEINRNNTDEHWHPECYMINKFWNIKLAPTPPLRKTCQPSTILQPPTTPITDQPLLTPSITSALSPSSSSTTTVTDWTFLESSETPQTLREKQKTMEEQVYRIWTVLSTFEESSAACISEMLRHVSGGHYLEGVRMAGKFILHVETLFAAIDDLEGIFRAKNAKEIPHVREARMLCKKIVNFFSLLSHTHETGARKMSITQELLSLVTGLAHYLKILIRIALTAALRLEREFGDRAGIAGFLSRLDRLARDPEASKAISSTTTATAPQQQNAGQQQPQHPNGVAPSSSCRTAPGRAYGYRSLTRAVGTLVGTGEATTDLCETCKQTVEEECVRFGTSLRWHTACLRCTGCHRSPPETQQLRKYKIGTGPVVYCEACGGEVERSANPNGTLILQDGLEVVTRLEQYAFLLCVALNKLYGLLKARGVLPASTKESRINGTMGSEERSLFDAYRNSTDIKRMKSVDLDRKLSTTARLPQRSTVIESPSGRVAQAAESTQPNGHSLRQPSRSPLPALQAGGRTRDISVPSQQLRERERDLRDLPRSEPPPRPLPGHLNMIPQNQSNGVSLNGSTGVASQPNGISVGLGARPTLSRNLTAIKIVEEPLRVLRSSDDPNSSLLSDHHNHNNANHHSNSTAGITLADLPRAMEAEQAREAHRALPTQAVTLSELSGLELVIVRHVAALRLASDYSGIRDETSLDELLEIIEARKGNFWGKLFKGNNEKAKVKKKGVFGVPLDVLIERHGVDSLLGAGAGQLRVPTFVDDCISAMKQMDMSVEGVFRKNGNIRRLKELTDAIDREDEASGSFGVVNFCEDNPVQLAALLKKFLRDLPDPLLTFKLHRLFIASQRVEKEEVRIKTLHLICCLLPKAHRDTMEVLFVFMKWVASFSHVDEETGSKMDLQNLATVITPNILYGRSKDPSRDESFLAIRAVHELLEHQDELFMVPEEVQMVMMDQELLNANINEITSKDIIKRVEALLKSNKPRLASTNNPLYRGKGEVQQPHRPDLHSAPAAPSSFIGGPLPASPRLLPQSQPTLHSNPGPSQSALPASPRPLPQQLQLQQQTQVPPSLSSPLAIGNPQFPASSPAPLPGGPTVVSSSYNHHHFHNNHFSASTAGGMGASTSVVTGGQNSSSDRISIDQRSA